MVVLVGVLLLVAGGVVSAVIVWDKMLGGRSASKGPAEPPRTASLTQPEGEERLPGKEREKAPPLPGMISGPAPKPAETELEKPAAPSPRPEMNGAPPGAETVAERGDMPPSRVREQPQPSAPEVSSPPAAESPPAVSPTPPPKVASPTPKKRADVPERPSSPQTDPFADIKLQGIILFDPENPEVLINGKSLKVGDSLTGIEVVKIGTDSVKLRYGTIEKTIRFW